MLAQHAEWLRSLGAGVALFSQAELPPNHALSSSVPNLAATTGDCSDLERNLEREDTADLDDEHGVTDEWRHAAHASDDGRHQPKRRKAASRTSADSTITPVSLRPESGKRNIIPRVREES